MQRGQEGKVFCTKNTTRSEPILAQPGETKGGDFFAKTEGERNVMERRPCRLNGHNLP